MLLLANLIYGINFTVAKWIMPSHVKPNGFIQLRTISACIFFILIVVLSRNFSKKIERNDWLRLIACGFFGVCINQVCFFKGLEYTTPIHASIIMTLVPILVVILSFFVLKNPITWSKIAGISVGIIGALLLIFNAKYKTTSFAPNPVLGDVLVFVNAASYAVYLILAKPLLAKYNPMLVMMWIFVFGFLFVSPIGISDVLDINWNSFGLREYASLAFVLLFVSCFTYLFNIISLKKLNPSTVSIYIYSQPLFSILFAITTGYDSLNFGIVIATLLIFLGVYWVNLSNFDTKSLYKTR